MLIPFLPLIVFAVDVTATPGSAPQRPPVAALEEESAPFLVAQALVDADQLVHVHQGPGVVVFDLDRASERFQLTVALDDDGQVVASTIDWVGPSDGAFGIEPTAVHALATVERIDYEPTRGVLVLRGGGHAARIVLGGQS